MTILLRLPEVEKVTGVKRSYIYAKIQSGEFPKPVKIGVKATAWPSDEIEGWIAARIAERDAS